MTAAIDSVAGSDYPSQLKLQAICYAVMGVAGERNFSAMMDNLRSYAAEAAEARRTSVDDSTVT